MISSFVTLKAFYPLVLQVPIPCSSAYIFFLSKEAPHSWSYTFRVGGVASDYIL
jgi:hypothetical protein